MAKKIKIYQIDAFTENPFEGNPAGVTFGDDLTNKEMQSIAKEMNLAETAFLTKQSSAASPLEKADYNLRWFTPTMEVELCGHATIASLHFLSELKKLKKNSSINFNTKSGVLKCMAEGEYYFMQIPRYQLKKYTGDLRPVLSALDLTQNDLDFKFPPVLLENGYLYIYIKSLERLQSIQPDFRSLLKLSDGGRDFGCVHVFTLETVDKESFAHGRFFAPYYGIDEDPVTGSANGPLMLVLMNLGFVKDIDRELNLVLEQGDTIGRRGRVGVRYIPSTGELYIFGKAVTVLKGEMSL